MNTLAKICMGVFIIAGAPLAFGRSQRIPDPVVPPNPPAPQSPTERYDYAPKTFPDMSKHYLKKRVAVARFGDNIRVNDSPFGQELALGASANQQGAVNVSMVAGDIAEESWLVPEKTSVMSDRFTDKLTHELNKSGRFVITERKDINSILRELEFQSTKYVSKAASEKVGDVLGAQIIVTGSIGYNDDNVEYWVAKLKEWALEDQDLRVKLASSGGRDRGAMENLRQQYRIKRMKDQRDALDESPPPRSLYMRLYEVGTSRIVDSVYVQGRTEKDLIHKAVRKLEASTEKIPWRGKLADVSGEIAYINAGRDMGLAEGYEFQVFSVGKEIKDPDTGTVIGHEEQVIGSIKIESVQDKVSKAKILKGAGQIKKGDVVEYKSAAI